MIGGVPKCHHVKFKSCLIVKLTEGPGQVGACCSEGSCWHSQRPAWPDLVVVSSHFRAMETTLALGVCWSCWQIAPISGLLGLVVSLTSLIQGD